MVGCWHPVPSQRPTFSCLVARLDSITESSTNYLDLNLQEKYTYYDDITSKDDPTIDNDSLTADYKLQEEAHLRLVETLGAQKSNI